MKLIEKFREYLLLEKKYSEHTVLSYTTDLLAFHNFCECTYATTALENIVYDQIRNWIVFLIDKHSSNRTVNRKIASLKAFYKYLLLIEQIEVNPLSNHKALKTPKSTQIPFSTKEVATALKDDPKDEDSFVILRDQLIVEMLYATGMRRAELIGLKVADVDFYRKQIKVLGKRNKERIIPLLESVILSLERYLTFRKRIVGDGAILELFVTEKGVKIYPNLVYRIINRYFREASTKEKQSPHIMRHSFATHLVSEGANLNTVKELLGHASLASTEVYTNQSIAQLRKVYEKAHPRNKK